MHSTSSASTSSSLIRQVQAHDPEAWKQLSQLYTPMAYGWCKRAGLQGADIADVVQNVFAAVHKGIHNFRRNRENDSFRGWLWTITRNEIFGHFRRLTSQPRASGGTDAQMAMQQVPEFFQAAAGPPHNDDQNDLLHRALRMIQADFEPTTWQAFWRTTVDGLSAPEVAEELHISPGAVRQAKHRVLERLRQFLSDD